VTRSVRTGDIEVELGAGTWTVRWPATGIVAGPFEAVVELGSGPRSSAGSVGRWQVEPGPGFGRAGVRARWLPGNGGPAMSLHLPADGAIVVSEVAFTSQGHDHLERLVPVRGAIDLGAVADVRRLVDGYDSWSYAGVRAAAERGASWWRTAFVRGDGRGAFALSALDAIRFATTITSRASASAIEVEVRCGATPEVAPVAGTWGYALHAPEPLRLPLRPGVAVRSPAVALGAGADAFAVIEETAELAGVVSDRRRWDGPPIAGWESWYHYGLFVEPDEILENARLLRERFAHVHGFDLVQIDDGWQVTYGDWRPNDRFPRDLTNLTGRLRGLGCRTGLWLAPFMVQPGAPGVARDHPEWMLHDAGGAPIVDRHGRYAIDALNAGAQEWLHDLGAQVRAWDVDMVKLDFLYLGAVEAERADPHGTGTQALRTGLRAFLDGLGDEVYVLACGAPTLPVVGLVHANRVGHDVAVPVRLREYGHPLDEGWTGFHGVRPQARNVAARWALHRRWFECDPDVVMAWGSGAPASDGGYPSDDARALATIAALCGGPFLLADDLAALAANERAVLEDESILELAHGPGFRPVDLFDRVDVEPEHFFSQGAPASVWRAEGEAGGGVTANFNFSDEPSSGLPPHGVGVVRDG
jgi:alpha-galactosidase